MAQSLGTQTRNVNMNRFGHANRRLQFYKRSQLFLRVHNETLSVAAMRVSNPDCSLARIHDCDAAPASSGLAEIVSDDFPIPLHALNCASFSLHTAMAKSYFHGNNP